MRFPWLAVVFVSCVRAQYFSEGWKPDQEVSSDSPNIAGEITKAFEAQQAQRTQQSRPAAPAPPEKKRKRTLNEILDFTWVLTTPPISSVFSMVGVNITERLAKAKEIPWDPRIPLITDENYEDIILNENLTEEEEKSRTWVIVVAADYHAGGFSPLFDGVFDEAFNETTTLNDLPNLRWGRIDYLNVTYITTKWVVWNAPVLVVLKDRGQTLRFFRPQYLPFRDGGLRTFLTNEFYLNAPAWRSSFSPGGSNEYILDWFAWALAKVYVVLTSVPRWVLYMFSGTIASTILQFMHRSSPRRPSRQASGAQTQTTIASIPTGEGASSKTSATSQKTQAKKRKGK